jgi:hypothetical protein
MRGAGYRRGGRQADRLAATTVEADSANASATTQVAKALRCVKPP